MLRDVQAANESGYIFMCADVPRKCGECANRLLLFTTVDIEEAFQHSKRNSVAMWITKTEEP